MPQFVTSTYISQIFWLIISFLSLWFVVAWIILPKIEEVLERRRRKIDDFVQKAEKFNKQALKSLNKYEKALAKANQNAQQAIEQNKKELEKIIADRHNEIEELLNKKIADTEFILATEKKETLAAIDDISFKIAQQLLIKLDIKNVNEHILTKTAGDIK